jgi:hypothetical protein
MESVGCPRRVPPVTAGRKEPSQSQRVVLTATGGGKDGPAANLRRSCPGQNAYFPTLPQLRHASYV